MITNEKHKKLSMDYFSNLSWKGLKSRLTDDPEYTANRELARRIVNNYEVVVNYYIGEMSTDIINRINRIMKRDSYGEYYEFLSSPFNEECKKPEWHKISLYEAIDCKLKTYTSTISCRHFYKIANKEQKIRNSETDLLEYKDYEALLLCDQSEDESEDITKQWMRNAFKELSERDQLVLKCLVIEKQNSLEAYESLKDLIHPIPKDGMTSEEVKANWSIKRRQDAMSLMKGQALKRLLAKYNEQKKK